MRPRIKMSLTNILQQGKSQFYEIIYKASTAFPYSNDLMHVGLIGALPYLVGRYGSELIVGRITNPINAETLRGCAPAVGFACAGIAEGIWSGFLEPGSKYDHPGDLTGKLKGVIETLAGAGLVWGGEKVVTGGKRR